MTCAARRGERGISLLELLVAMAVLSLVVMTMTGGLRFASRAWDRQEQKASDLGDIHAVQSFLRRAIEQAYPAVLKREAGEPEAKPPIAFEGARDALTFSAPLPEPAGPGGHYRIRLDLANDGRATHLALAWTVERNQAIEPRPAAPPNSRVILSAVSGVDLTYLGPDDRREQLVWTEGWAGKRELPKLVRLRVAFPPGDGRVWPDLVVAPMLDRDARCVFEPAAKACKPR